MKMNYLQKNNNQKLTKDSFKKTFYLFFGLLVINFLFGGFLKNVFYKISYPQQKVYSFINDNTYYFSNIFTSKQNLVLENKHLNETIANLRQENSQLKTIETLYNKILEISTTTKEQLVLPIISKPPFSPYDTIILSYNPKVAIGDFVFYENTLLGYVDSIKDPHISVRLFSASKTENKFYVDRTSNPITVSGIGSGNLYAQIPKDFDLNVGDILIDDLTHRHKIAVVSSIDGEDALSFKYVYFKIPVSFYNISFVSILK